jgi:DNA-directed RNA polymerase alpha subunit
MKALQRRHAKRLTFAVVGESEQEEKQPEEPKSKGPLTSLNLGSGIVNALEAAGVTTVDQLAAMTPEAVVDVKGIADAGLADIEEALLTVELTLAEEEGAK